MTDFEKVFRVFRKNYVEVPLEIYGQNPYKTLVATLMSSRTNDATTLKASERLFKHAPSLEQLAQLELSELEKLIFPVGFYKTKAKHLKKLASILTRTPSSGVTPYEIPNTREGLMSLPGVGRKTANLVLNRAFGIPAIAVDTHVHRISNLLGWVNTKSPEETEKALIKLLPKSYWSETNKLFVSIGRQFTTKKRLEDFLTKEGLI